MRKFYRSGLLGSLSWNESGRENAESAENMESELNRSPDRFANKEDRITCEIRRIFQARVSSEQALTSSGRIAV